MKKIFLFAAASAALLSCQTNNTPKVAAAQTIDMDAAKKLIDAANTKFGNAMAAGDSATLVSMYHSEAQVLPPNAPLGDRTGMGSMVKSLPQMGVKKVELKTTELLNGGDYVIEKGTWELGDGAKSFEKGKYLVVWKQENGEWKLFRDIWNGDAPPAPAGK